MPDFDLPLDDLEQYHPDVPEPAGFDAFWEKTLAESAALATAPVFDEVTTAYGALRAWDVTFSGFGGHPIRGWLLIPRGAIEPLPALISYLGYGSGRGLPGEWTAVPSAGYAHFVMDLRGQGSAFRSGDTADGTLSGPHAGGVLTRGIDDPENYYYRRLFTDAVLAVQAVQAHPLVDPARILITGGSQGGAISLACAALAPLVLATPPRAAVIEVPFLSHVRRAVRIVETEPYGELVRYLRARTQSAEHALATLDYFDGVHFASRATIPALYAVGLWDAICPPSTVYAAFNRYAGEKRMIVYPWSGHENGGAAQLEERLRFAQVQVG